MSGPTTFKVTERLGPLGTLAKLPIDYREATLDFTRWLAPGEILASIEQYGIVTDPEVPCNGSWSLAFDCSGCCSETIDPPPVDNNPLEVLVASVLPGGVKGTLLIGQGTAGLTYGLSFLAVALPTQRRKAVDLLVCVGTPMVDIELPTPPPPPPFQYVTDDAILPIGTSGSIFVNNTSDNILQITLPASPLVDQQLDIKDIAGTAATHNILIKTQDGSQIDDMATYTIAYGFGNLGIIWTGLRWSIM